MNNIGAEDDQISVACTNKQCLRDCSSTGIVWIEGMAPPSSGALILRNSGLLYGMKYLLVNVLVHACAQV